MRRFRHLPPSVALAIVLSAVCLALLGVRVVLASQPTFWFLSWNLLLAWVPLTLAWAIAIVPHRRTIGILQVPLFLVWLAFLPNAPYLATDLIHLGNRPSGSPSIDFPMFVAFAVTGVLIFLMSLRTVHQALLAAGTRTAQAIVVACIWLTGIGIYLGRVLQWNSWDLLDDPFGRIAALSEELSHGGSLATAGMLIVGFAVCLTAAYAAFAAINGSSSPRRP